MFRFAQEPSSRSYNQCLAKITSQLQQFVLVVSVMAAYSDECAAITLTTSVPT